MAAWLVLFLLYVGGCFTWSCSALRKYLRLRDCFKQLPEDVKRTHRAFQRPDYFTLSPAHMMLGGLFLLPIRFGIYVTFKLKFIFLTKLMALCLDEKGPTYQRIFGIMELLYGRLGLFLLGVVSIKHHGTRRDRAQPRNYVSNHVSAIDILTYMCITRPSFVAKESISRSPIFGHLGRAMDTVFVKRECAEGRARAAIAIKDRQASTDAGTRNRSFVVFPEGTTTNGRYLIPFKKGAFERNGPLYPIVLIYSCPILDISYEIIPFWWWIPLAFSSPGMITAHVHWLEPVQSNDPSEVYAAQVHKQMAKLIFEQHKSSWDYSTTEKDISNWNGSYRSKVHLFGLLLKGMGLSVNPKSW